MRNRDFVVVGAGLTGATIARLLTDRGHRVAVIERRPHVGGQLYDYMHPCGIRVHAHGPHYFRTDSEEVWEFVNRFADFYPFHAVVKSKVGGRLESWPITTDYIAGACDWEDCSPMENFEQACLLMMPRSVYKGFVAGYTFKQWACSPTELDAGLASRFEIRDTLDERLFTHEYQGLPSEGYTAMIENMLDGIPVVLNKTFTREPKGSFDPILTFHTGPLDEYFEFSDGKLNWRAQSRLHVAQKEIGFLQPVPQVNYPGVNTRWIRSIEWKHMMPPDFHGSAATVITYEEPYTPAEPNRYEYPFPDKKNRLLQQNYEDRLPENVVPCGRLGSYEYIDMDTAIQNAMALAEVYG